MDKAIFELFYERKRRSSLRNTESKIFSVLFDSNDQSMVFAFEFFFKRMIQRIANKNFCLHRVMYNG
jgi:hypothetical protein